MRNLRNLPLGQLLTRRGLLTERQLQQAITVQRERGERLCVIAYRLEGAPGEAAGSEAADLPAPQERDSAGIIRLVGDVLEQGRAQGASDIHLEPLGEALRLPLHLAAAFVARIKVMAQLDIAERRLPQDGRLELVLVRRLCPRCREVAADGPGTHAPVMRSYGVQLPDGPYYRPVGCGWCGQQGYKGRIPVFELRPVTPGVAKALAGETSLAEVQRVLLGEA